MGFFMNLLIKAKLIKVNGPSAWNKKNKAENNDEAGGDNKANDDNKSTGDNKADDNNKTDNNETQDNAAENNAAEKPENNRPAKEVISLNDLRKKKKK